MPIWYCRAPFALYYYIVLLLVAERTHSSALIFHNARRPTARGAYP